MKLTVPKFLTQRPAFLTRKPAKARTVTAKKLHAATASRRMTPAMDDDYDDGPTTKLSSAFFVVLILHVVAVSGIYAFNYIKAHRRSLEPSVAETKKAETKAPAAAPQRELAAASEATADDVKPASLNSAAIQEVNRAPSVGKTYTVKSGDNQAKVAIAVGVSIAELQMVNPGKDLSVLKVGQVLNVPVKKTAERFTAVEQPATTSKPAPKTEETSSARSYVVKKGDTATSIAKKSGCTVDELLKLNKISDPKKLQLGQSLKLPAKKG